MPLSNKTTPKNARPQNNIAMEQHTDLTKLARWVIPGWVAAFSFFLFVAIDTFTCTGDVACAFQDVSEFTSKIATIDPVLAALLVTTGVPAGLLIYQFYYYWRWSSPTARRGFTSLAPGIMTDLHQSLRNMDTPAAKAVLARGEPWRLRLLAHPLYDTEHGFKSRYIDFLFTELVSETNDTLFYQRHRYLHEITHVLGGALTAVTVGFLGYTIFKFHHPISPLPISYILVSLFLTGALAAFLESESRWIENIRRRICFTPQCRQKLSRTAAESPLAATCIGKRVAYAHPSAFMIVTLLFIHLVANPYFETRPLFSPPGPGFAATCWGNQHWLSPHSCLFWLFLALAVAALAITIYVLTKNTLPKAKALAGHIAIAIALPLSIYLLSKGVRISLEGNASYTLYRAGTIARLLLMGAAALWWVLTVNKEYPPLSPFFWGAVIQGAASIFIALGAAWASFYLVTDTTVIDWPYLTSLTLFLLMFLILMRNRHNAKNELLSLEYIFLSKNLKPPCTTLDDTRTLSKQTAARLARFLNSAKLW